MKDSLPEMKTLFRFPSISASRTSRSFLRSQPESLDKTELHSVFFVLDDVDSFISRQNKTKAVNRLLAHSKFGCAPSSHVATAVAAT